jgi:hypothetical protein
MGMSRGRNDGFIEMMLRYSTAHGTNVQARIKKIMQMDEEVGKLASATPVMICKSRLIDQHLPVERYEGKRAEVDFQ